jgi:hypothetical protein
MVSSPMGSLKLYLSAIPEQKFNSKILQSEIVSGIRCNTGAFTSKLKTNILQDFRNNTSPKTAWVDLKGRELRIINDANVPDQYLELNHKISVKTPTELYYNEGKGFLIIEEVVDENKLKIKTPKNSIKGQELKFGKGASINIPDASLRTFDYFTKNDKDYIEAALKIGLHNYFLSYVESTDEIKELLNLDPLAKIYGKIESKNGLKFVRDQEKGYDKIKKKLHLIAARGDLYIELDRPHEILAALKLIISKDPEAIAASRILDSFMETDKIPRCADICDIGYLLNLGYRSFLLGDDMCANENALLSAIGLFSTLEE